MISSVFSLLSLVWLINSYMFSLVIKPLAGTAYDLSVRAINHVMPPRRLLLAPPARTLTSRLTEQQHRHDMVVPLLKPRVCSVCRLPRDGNAFPSAMAKRCLACVPLVHTKDRKPGRHRLWTAQCNRVRAELRKAGVPRHASEATADLLGCRNAAELWSHMAPKLAEGMTEDNYGEWHVDHVTPIAAFDLTRPDHRARCFNAANMAPMWACDNMTKSSTLGVTSLAAKQTHKPARH